MYATSLFSKKLLFQTFVFVCADMWAVFCHQVYVLWVLAETHRGVVKQALTD